MTNTLNNRQRLTQPLINSDGHISDLGKSDEVNCETRASKSNFSVQPASEEVEIIHATTGRVRIGVCEGSDNSALEEISESLRSSDGVKEVTIHQQTGSLVVKFDENKLSLPQMLALLKQMGIGMQTSQPGASQKDPFAAWKSIDFWKEQGISFIPLFAGLGVTGALGISGWVSIPVYIVTANATRRAIDYFELDTDETKEPPTISQRENKSAINRNTTQPSTTVQNKSTFVSSQTNEAKTSKIAEQPAKIIYSVVHAIPGRIRFNVPKLAQDKAYARRLERMLKTDSEVKSVRLNCDAASIAISYKQSHIPLSHWVGMMILADQAVAPQAVKTTEPTETVESILSIKDKDIDISSLWADYKPPTMTALLDVMANLSLDAVSGREKAGVSNGS